MRCLKKLQGKAEGLLQRYGRSLALLGLLLYGISLLLKLKPPAAAICGLGLLLLLPAHEKQSCREKEERCRLEEVSLYLDVLLSSFRREGKILLALKAAEAGLPDGRLREELTEELDYIDRTYGEEAVLPTALARLEEAYPCRRVRGIHRLMLHVEAYGGSTEEAIGLLLEDKRRWMSRIRQTMQERSSMLRQNILSCAASVFICGSISYLPAMGMDISSNPLSQALAVVVVLTDDLILLKSRTYLIVDWLQADQTAADEELQKRRLEYHCYEEEREKRKSLYWCLACLPLLLFAIWRRNSWLLLAGLLLLWLCSNQHRIGRYLSRKKLRKAIEADFPAWLLDLILLLQSENVQVALRKSGELAPKVLQEDIRELLEGLERAPEAAWPYHRFLEDMEIPEVRAAMSLLCSLSNGDAEDASERLAALVSDNLDMLHGAELSRFRDQSSGMYLLFLAPVVTASAKLLADMAIFLLQFISMEVMG